MEPLRLFLTVCAALFLQVFLLPWIPFGRIVLDPVLLVFIFFALRVQKSRFLWLSGALFGLLKDIVDNNLFGLSAVGFASVGVVLAFSRHAIEREDPFIQGIVAGIAAVIVILVTGILCPLVDSAVGWNRWEWVILPAAAAANGLAASAVFPRLDKLLKRHR